MLIKSDLLIWKQHQAFLTHARTHTDRDILYLWWEKDYFEDITEARERERERDEKNLLRRSMCQWKEKNTSIKGCGFFSVAFRRLFIMHNHNKYSARLLLFFRYVCVCLSLCLSLVIATNHALLLYISSSVPCRLHHRLCCLSPHVNL